MLSGPPLIAKSGAVVMRLTFGRTYADTDLLTNDSVVTVNLYGPDGLSVLSASATATIEVWSTVLFTFAATATPTATLTVGQAYRAVWTWTIENDAGTPETASGVTSVDLYATPYPQISPPISATWITVCNPGLGTAPASGGWVGQAARAWYEIVLWVIRQRRGSLWSVSELMVPLEHLTLHYIWRAKAGYGNPSALANAAAERTAYDLALKAVQLTWDNDGDGDVDQVAGPAGSATDAGPVV